VCRRRIRGVFPDRVHAYIEQLLTLSFVHGAIGL
jgi:hypothetical protein